MTAMAIVSVTQTKMVFVMNLKSQDAWMPKLVTMTLLRRMTMILVRMPHLDWIAMAIVSSTRMEMESVNRMSSAAVKTPWRVTTMRTQQTQATVTLLTRVTTVMAFA